METLVGKVIRHASGYGTFVEVKSVTDDGLYYNCVDLGDGRKFTALKQIYDKIFIPKIKREIKPKGTKGDNINFLRRK